MMFERQPYRCTGAGSGRFNVQCAERLDFSEVAVGLVLKRHKCRAPGAAGLRSKCGEVGKARQLAIRRGQSKLFQNTCY